MIIGIDMDDVLMYFNEHMLRFLNKKYGTNHQRKDSFDFTLENVWKESSEIVQRKILEFYMSAEHDQTESYPGAIEGVRALKAAGHDLHVITSKPDMLRGRTEAWLGQHFPGMFTEVHFMNHLHSTNKKMSKAEACKNLGVEIFIDDAIHNAKNVATLGIPVLLLDAPWNQEKVDAPIVRVMSWEEIVEKIQSGIAVPKIGVVG